MKMHLKDIDLLMYEHRLYGIERWGQGKKIAEKILLCTPKQATWYSLQGWTVFDFHESLGMEPEYYLVDKSNSDAIIYTY